MTYGKRKMVEVGEIENECYRNFQHPIGLRRVTQNCNDFQLLFGFICFWKIRVFLPQYGTNPAQTN